MLDDLAAQFGPMLRTVSLTAVPLLLALTVHEAAHGLVAFWLGDPTARRAGRLTLNPLKHLDPMGTLLPLVLLATGVRAVIGWAKPVPVNPGYFRKPDRDMMLVALAGPGSNLLLAALFGQVLNLIITAAPHPDQAALPFLRWMASAAYSGVFINAALALFNMLPIPPLDGSNILSYFLPPGPRAAYQSVGRYGMIAVIVLAMTGLLGQIIGPLIETVGAALLPSGL